VSIKKRFPLVRPKLYLPSLGVASYPRRCENPSDERSGGEPARNASGSRTRATVPGHPMEATDARPYRDLRRSWESSTILRTRERTKIIAFLAKGENESQSRSLELIHSFSLSRVTSDLAPHMRDVRSWPEPNGVAAISEAKGRNL